MQISINLQAVMGKVRMASSSELGMKGKLSVVLSVPPFSRDINIQYGWPTQTINYEKKKKARNSRTCFNDVLWSFCLFLGGTVKVYMRALVLKEWMEPCWQEIQVLAHTTSF